MGRVLLGLGLGLCGCSQLFGLDSPALIDANIAVDGAEADAALDSPVPGTFNVLHVPTAGQAPGTADLVVSNEIDTTALTIDGMPLPAGIVFDVWPQVGGPDLAVLHVRTMRVAEGSHVYVPGSRSLVVIASGEITIAGTLNASALRDLARAGGGAAGAGLGAGNAGGHVGTYRESGGSGGGFGGAGGGGGRGGVTAGACSPAAAVAGGTTYGDASLSVLVGGSGGGRAYETNCGSQTGGAGGGAVQLSSATRIVVTGTIDVGGGGGGHGLQCAVASYNLSAGSGGGSGGAIVLQAPSVSGTGNIAANGGSGGSAAGADTGGPKDGLPGVGGTTTLTPAPGGADVGLYSSAGGDGGAGPTPAQAGANATECEGNGGGGGGGVGRIVIATPENGTTALSGVVSPSAVAITY